MSEEANLSGGSLEQLQLCMQFGVWGLDPWLKKLNFKSFEIAVQAILLIKSTQLLLFSKRNNHDCSIRVNQNSILMLSYKTLAKKWRRSCPPSPTFMPKSRAANRGSNGGNLHWAPPCQGPQLHYQKDQNTLIEQSP